MSVILDVTYDLIIVSKSTKDFIPVTQNCIDSARKDNADLNVIIVETDNKYDYEDARVVMYEGEFCYNKALNMGLKHAKGDIHILANNDIIFREGWSKIGEQMIVNGFDSASALSTDYRQHSFKRGEWIYEGYGVGSHLTGWCIFATKECIKTIGKLDESFDFWYSDNIYADQLKKAGLRHGLFCNVYVDHMTSTTFKTVGSQLQRRFIGSEKRYHSIKIKYAN